MPGDRRSNVASLCEPNDQRDRRAERDLAILGCLAYHLTAPIHSGSEHLSRDAQAAAGSIGWKSARPISHT